MGKVFLGLVSGIVLTSAAFLVLNSESGSDSSSIADTSSVRPSTPQDQPQITASDVPENAGSVQVTDSSTNTDIPLPELTENYLRSLTPEELQSLVERAEDERPANQQQYLAVIGEKFRRETIERWSNEPPPTQPISLPSEFSYLSLSDRPDHDHEQLQREPIDPVWSAVTEGQIATFLSEHPEITQKYGHPTVNCRTTGCELAFVSYGLEEPAFQMFFGGAFKSVSEEPWSEQFDNSWDNLFDVRKEGDVTTILWHLWQKSE